MQGTCLCGAITVSTHECKQVDACHCSMCRRWSGGPHLGVQGGTDVRIDGKEALTVYASSKWAERAFCRHCGSHIYYHLLATGEKHLPAGLFQDTDGFEFTTQIYIDRKPSWYTFANETRTLTESEVLALFAAQDDGKSST